MGINDFASTIGKGIQQATTTNKTEFAQPSSTANRFLFNKYKAKVQSTKVLVEDRTIGDAFILGHATNGVLGTSKLGEGTMGAWSDVEKSLDVVALTDVGRDEIAAFLATEVGAASLTDFAVGTDSTASSVDDTALGAEVDRKNVTIFDVGTSLLASFETTVLSTETGFQGSAIREIGLLNAAVAGDLFSRHIISSLTMVNTKEYRFTIDYSISNTTTGNAVFTTAGMNSIRDWLGGTSITAPTHDAWGTGQTNPVVGDTTLEGEQQRNATLSTGRLNNVVTITSILTTAQANGVDLYKSGLFNAGAAGTLYCEREWAKIEKTAAIQVTNTNTITVE
jgi:hypothetical protein